MMIINTAMKRSQRKSFKNSTMRREDKHTPKVDLYILLSLSDNKADLSPHLQPQDKHVDFLILEPTVPLTGPEHLGNSILQMLLLVRVYAY